MMRWTGWDSEPLLQWIGNFLHLHGSRLAWWHEYGARIIDAGALDCGALLLLIIAWSIWKIWGRQTTRAATSLWIGLLILVFGGFSLLFSLGALPADLHDNRLTDSRRLATILSQYHVPIYIDQFTAKEMRELADLFNSPLADLRVQQSLDDATVRQLLQSPRGCIVIDEPSLDAMRLYRITVGSSAYALSTTHPAGWSISERFTSTVSRQEYVTLLCRASSRAAQVAEATQAIIH